MVDSGSYTRVSKNTFRLVFFLIFFLDFINHYSLLFVLRRPRVSQEDLGYAIGRLQLASVKVVGVATHTQILTYVDIYGHYSKQEEINNASSPTSHINY